jgi:hypothetical protein
MLQAELMTDEGLFWQPTDPVRFDDKDLRERELSYGKGGFALQFMLNPNLSDMEKYPLKLRDFIVGTFALDKGPTMLTWLPNTANECKGVPLVGLKGDRFHKYESVGQSQAAYMQKILVIDPSGRGKDETGYAVLYQLNGYIYLMDIGGFRGGYDDTTLQALANLAKIYRVNEVVIEGNFGDGMYVKLIAPVIAATFPCAVTEVKSKGQKEMRICDVLEPVLGSHRLVIQESLIEKDYKTALNNDGTTDIKYSAMYQLSRITRERGSLAHDDRLDALAIGVQFFTDAMEKDSKVGESEMMQEFLEAQMENQLMGFEDIRRIAVSESVDIYYEDDGTTTNFMGW